MSLTFVLILMLVVTIFMMLSKIFSDIPKNSNYKSYIELAKYDKLPMIYLSSVSVILAVWLIVYVAQHQSSLLAIFYIILIIFTWRILLNFSFLAKNLANFISPYFLKFVELIDPFSQKLVKLWLKIFKNSPAKIYQKQELIDLLLSQKNNSPDTANSDLELSINGLKFSQLVVKDYYTPRKVVKFLDSESEITTVLLDDLYKSGFSRFPVYSETPDNVVGTLYLKDLVEKRYSGKVAKIMTSEVYEISGDAKLDVVLRKFVSTRHHLFIVENEFKEMLGVITLEDVLEQLIGKEIVDESDNVVDLRQFAKEDKNKTTA